MKFKPGDLVRLVEPFAPDNNDWRGYCDDENYFRIGKVIYLSNISDEERSILVDWGSGFDGHSGGDRLPNQHGWWVLPSDLMLVRAEMDDPFLI